MFKIQRKIVYAIEAVIDIALNSGTKPVQNISIADRQGIPKRYLEQTLQLLVKNNILVGSRGPRGGYILARERRKIFLSEIIRSVDVENKKKNKGLSDLSKKVISPMIKDLTKKCLNYFETVSVDEICRIAKKKNVQPLSERKVDFDI